MNWKPNLEHQESCVNSDSSTPRNNALVHFVAFRGEEYWSAVKVWGPPDFIHRGWDLRARREIADGDTIVLAQGEHDQVPQHKSFDDLTET
jgi:hypothetical protein